MVADSSALLKKSVLLLVLLVAVCAAAEPAQFIVNVPVVNMYSGPSTDTDVVSQAIYSTTVSVVEDKDAWLKIKTPGDDYQGWVERSALLPVSGDHLYASSGQVAEVRELAAHLYREPSVTAHAPVLTLPFESHVEIASIKPGDKRWVEVRLIDGKTAWIQQGDVMLVDAKPGHALKAADRPLSIPEMVAFAKQFLGRPYTWGGRSSFGYDCSGFVQMLMRQRGYLIPRDADVQAAWTGFKPVDKSDLQAGDVLYFGSKGNITHTGMYIGDGLFIHATTHDHPVIQISRLADNPWPKLLVAQRRAKQ